MNKKQIEPNVSVVVLKDLASEMDPREPLRKDLEIQCRIGFFLIYLSNRHSGTENFKNVQAKKIREIK